MIGIRQQHLRAQLFQLILGNGLYRPPRADRHEGGRFNLAVRGAEHSGTRAGSLILRDNFETFGFHKGCFIARIEKAERVAVSENLLNQVAGSKAAWFNLPQLRLLAAAALFGQRTARMVTATGRRGGGRRQLGGAEELSFGTGLRTGSL